MPSRNFAAGMSGGIAYVLDETGDFGRVLCNRASVDLDEVDAADAELLEGLITRHVALTQSPRAQWILEHWPTMLPKFVKVFPHEYKRVLGVARTASVPKPVPPQPAKASAQAIHG